MIKLIKTLKMKGICMKKLNTSGYFLSLLFPLVLFLSFKGEQTLSYIILFIFLISMFSKDNRSCLVNLIDKKLASGLLIFILSPFAVSLFSGGLSSRVDIDHYLYWIIFFPLVFFINTEGKMWKFLAFFLTGGLLSLCITFIIFINNYDSWANPKGFEYPRIHFELQTQDFANIMCILLLFLLSFILFYRHNNKKRNMLIKGILTSIFLLNLFIIIVNRSKMVYICLIPTIAYLLYRKNRKYILGFLASCIGGYFLLPHSIRDRLQYIIKIKEDPSSNLRLIFWDAAISSSLKSPIWGMTTEERIAFNTEHFKSKGVWEYIARNYGVSNDIGLTNTHNMYLHHLSYYGVAIIPLFYFFFIAVPSRLIKLSYYKVSHKGMSAYVALEMALKASYAAYLIQGITEFNLNKKPMIFMCVILLLILNFIYKKNYQNNRNSNF